MADEPKSYAGLDWAALRAEYETTDISVVALAAKHNITSRNTITRRIQREGWTRRIGDITAHLVTREIAQAGHQDRAAQVARPPSPPTSSTTVSPPPTAPKPPPAPSLPPAAPRKREGRPTDTVGALATDTFAVPDGLISAKPKRARVDTPDTGDDTASDTRLPPGRPRKSHGESGGGPDDTATGGPRERKSLAIFGPARAAAVTGEGGADTPSGEDEIDIARGVAHLHAQAIRRQMGVGREVQELGMRLLRALDLVVSSDDAATAHEAAMRVLGVNPDKDTMQALLKAGVGVVEQGIQIERRALAMDVVKAAGPVQPTGPDPSANTAMDMIRRADPELALRMREVAKELAGKRHIIAAKTIEGVVEATS